MGMKRIYKRLTNMCEFTKKLKFIFKETLKTTGIMRMNIELGDIRFFLLKMTDYFIKRGINSFHSKHICGDKVFIQLGHKFKLKDLQKLKRRNFRISIM